MATNSRIPPLLRPYLVSPPPNSLVLLTNTLGTSSNWLIIRYLCGALSGDAASRIRVTGRGRGDADSTPGHGEEDIDSSEITAVVLVSWTREFEFWRTETRRAAVCTIWQLLCAVLTKK